jgi:hypothetical protein
MVSTTKIIKQRAAGTVVRLSSDRIRKGLSSHHPIALAQPDRSARRAVGPHERLAGRRAPPPASPLSTLIGPPRRPLGALSTWSCDVVAGMIARLLWR